MKKIAVVLFNLGGPDSLDTVQPFLFNLFNDPNIIKIPAIVRTPLALLISKLRARKKAKAIYAALGGRSPLLENTDAQARALEKQLINLGSVRVFIAMRYWHPMSEQVAKDVKEFNPDEIVLLPLYPQLSTTTTASSRRVWQIACDNAGLKAPTHYVCCYPTDSGFIEAQTALAHPHIEAARTMGPVRVLFSAHGLPEKIVKDGDPYQWQIEQSCQALAEKLQLSADEWQICYQSRVGPMKWIGPSSEQALAQAAQDKRHVVLVPMSFVSEHSETLYELDQEYKHLAQELGIVSYQRVPTVSVHPLFIAGLADQVKNALKTKHKICAPNGKRICPYQFSGCPHAI